MAEELVQRFAAHSIDLPDLTRLPAAGVVAVWAFGASGEAAVRWWRRLREVAGPTGYWPVLVAHDGVDVGRRDSAHDDEHALARAAGLDGAMLVNPQGETLSGQGPDAIEAHLEQWPEEPDDVVRLDRLTLPYQDGSALALVPASAGWQVPALLGFGGWNSCPEPAVHAAVLKYWGERYGAELASLTGDGLELDIARPPHTQAGALELAWEYAEYCADGVDGLYEADTLAQLAASLIDADVVHLWWD
ncbi:MAG TPA: DUF4253 domain-containing protein [Trebonia sp.]|nr:DUF4253 domain-containing protein [Trebonia sp.]